MPNNIKIGQIGEDLACQYLLNNEYKILDRNCRYTWGEIDVICTSKDGTLVFVEVKALRASNKVLNKFDCFTPEENLSLSKLEKVKRTAYLYANANPGLIKENRGWRIDLVAIEINHPEPEKIEIKDLLKQSQIRHYENI
jgi:putative endonuclease